MQTISLNPEQDQAVRHRTGPLLILAGAGSGKTRVIVNRIVHLLKHQVDPHHILAVSFTNRAVREMEERIGEMLKAPKVAKKLTLCTFHSLGVRILRQDIDLLNYPRRFTIYDSGDQVSMMRRIMRERKIDDKRYDAKSFLASISQAKNASLEPQAVRDTMVRELFQAYDDNLRACGAVDFDDLIRLPVRLLREFPTVLDKWAGRFRQIMIDEYQDTNRAQLLMVRELASVHNNLCVVGDDDQSIYGWRGSDVENIRTFDRQFAGTRVIKLTQNYRCSGNILAAANRVIAQGEGRYQKELWTDQGAGEKIGIAVLPDEASEARFVVEHLQNQRYDKQHPWGDFAIMYRTNAQSRAFEELMRNERIPYRMVGGTKFFERKEIRDLLAYLKVLHSQKDEISLRRILNYPARGIGNTTVERIHTYAKTHNLSFYEACQNIDVIDTIGKAQKKPVIAFTAMISDLTTRLRGEDRVSTVVSTLLTELNFQNNLYKEYSDLTEAKKRVDNVDALVNSILQYEERIPNPSLYDYLERVTLDNRTEEDDEQEEDAVTLITLHGAKGLEFPVVYLVGLEEGFLPYFRTFEADSDLEEERRLCYVGITRAKKKLVITRAIERRRFGRTLDRDPSRFLSDIPKELLQPLNQEDLASSRTEEERDKKFKSFFSEVFDIINKD